MPRIGDEAFHSFRERRPIELRIPRLGVRAAVDRVGGDPQGMVAVPEESERVGWYRFGPRPGAEAGSAVLVGHVDFDSGRLGVFAALNRIRQDDRVIVRDEPGRQWTFTVRARQTVPKEELRVRAASGVTGRPSSRW